VEQAAIQQLLDLRSVDDDVARGYLFEQAIREFVPWGFRPPLSVRAKGEQIDAFYEWNSWHFLLEAKAVRKSISRAEHEWEDFELKVRRRRGGCIGLFCSLFPISDNVVEAAVELNRDGIPTIILSGKVWEELAETRIPITDLLRYMVLHAKASGAAIPPNLSVVHTWCYNHEHISSKIQSLCRSTSATFLRRHILPKHSQIYVPREIDRRIESIVAQLYPASLSQREKRRTRKRGQQKLFEYVTGRQMPPQICMIRDASGSGKTTLSLQIALTTDKFFGIGRAASEINVDDTLSILDRIGPDSGIEALTTLNKPLVFALDSLDEAVNIPGKREEVLALIRLFDGLNEKAQQADLVAFPLLIVFTVREDYWRYWDSIFEGVHAVTFRKMFTQFDQAEFFIALTKYSQAYNYVVNSEPGSDAINALSVPFNLHVFSEANEFSDYVSFADVFDERVLQVYFERKCDNILRRRVAGFSGAAFIQLASEFAIFALRAGRRMIMRREAIQIIKSQFPNLYSEADVVLLALLSEGIMSREPNNLAELRFRHSRYMEYLLAQFIVRAFDEGQGRMEDMTGEVFESGIVSMYRVHDFVRFICHHEYPHLYNQILDVYAQSDKFMAGHLANLRADIGHGTHLSKEDVSIIRRSLSTSSPSVSWNAFFALAAKKTEALEEWVLEAFEIAWKANSRNPERWRLLDRLASRALLLRGDIIERIVESPYSREWEFLFGRVLESNEMRTEWREILPDMSRRIEEALSRRTGEEWHHACKLWNILVEGTEYIPGDLY
jgi:hypothetical protein